MVSYISLLVVIISVKNNQSCSTGVTKYKIAKGLMQSIKFKYFFPTDYPSQTFTTRDIVFILGKYIIENSELCFTVTYSSIVDSGNPKRKFDTKTVQYNSITGNSEVKMDIIVIYPYQSVRFKYLGHLGSNIKLRSNYFNQPKSSRTMINTNFESGPSDDKKNYYTTVEDYQSEEEQFDHEDLNKIDNEK
ncbi:43302_t:CDS:2, partial [Gigaspora margarita]